MIKLIDLLKEIQHNQHQITEIENILGRPLTESELNELDLKRAAKNLAVGTALGAATMFGSPKASAQTTQPTSISTVKPSAKKTVLINSDSLNQFKFSQEFIDNWLYHFDPQRPIPDSAIMIQNLKSLQAINKNYPTTKKSERNWEDYFYDWNNFVDWMKEKGYQNKEIDQNILDEYNKVNPEFFIKSLKGLNKLINIVKGYRNFTMSIWKLGSEAYESDRELIDISINGSKMDPSNPSDVKTVENDYMSWAK